MIFFEDVVNTYVNDQPKHVSCPEESYFMVLPKAEFSSMTTCAVQAYLEMRNIVIPDMQLPSISFDRQGFRQLDSLNRTVDIEGMAFYSCSNFPISRIYRPNYDTRSRRFFRTASTGNVTRIPGQCKIRRRPQGPQNRSNAI